MIYEVLSDGSKSGLLLLYQELVSPSSMTDTSRIQTSMEQHITWSRMLCKIRDVCHSIGHHGSSERLYHIES